MECLLKDKSVLRKAKQYELLHETDQIINLKSKLAVAARATYACLFHFVTEGAVL